MNWLIQKAFCELVFPLYLLTLPFHLSSFKFSSAVLIFRGHRVIRYYSLDFEVMFVEVIVFLISDKC